ncbi:TetR family transcriptional regulator [Ensifer sp. LC13]|nr:TetR family transcriptional regulator [Ensifer sp. LC13]OCP10792.1 TetR family transcriptional regulator [Ensifer sp. LC11]OCP14096.1 TetR family transcriptional regulator [Ensifer sp. LC14]OCP32865.1 TetR family transcriptional regulator [Ensifer sp. LC499]
MERTRKVIVAAASELFLKRGFLGTNMDEIAASAEVSKQTVYSHFQNKEALFLEVVRSMTGGAGDEFQEQVADPDGGEPIEEFLLDYASRLLEIVMTPRLMQVRRLVIAEVERFPQLGQALHERGPMRSINRLAVAFTRYSEKGDIRVKDAHVAGAFFNWLVMGGPVNDAMLLGDDGIPSAGALRTHAEEAVRIFLAAHRSYNGR